MSGFSDHQLRDLRGKLPARHVLTRESNGFELSYVEGWFTIAEANRIFGFDAWDRETVALACVWQGKAQGGFACSYTARVRLTVRAGETVVVREGCGYGTGSGGTPGEAHEKALKEAETDAMKRALVTFGNRFGLALYDRAQRGVTRPKPTMAPEPWPIRVPGTDEPVLCASPHEVFAELRKRLERLTTPTEVQDLWHRNETTLRTLRERHRELVNGSGAHYSAVFARLCRQRAQDLGHPRPDPDAPPVDKSLLPIGTPRLIRDRDHLAAVAARPCFVCGRLPAQAHHLTFMQPRARGLKTSDEWVVPLCALHHRELHDRGNERLFWADHRLDPEAEALALWQESRGNAPTRPGDELAATAPILPWLALLAPVPALRRLTIARSEPWAGKHPPSPSTTGP